MQFGIIVALYIIEPPETAAVTSPIISSKVIYDYPSIREVHLICNLTTLGVVAPLGYNGLLILSCTFYAFKTRNVPANFNEAKYIAFTMYTTCIIWLAFVPIYFGSNYKIITMCFSVSLSATVALCCMFVPKVRHGNTNSQNHNEILIFKLFFFHFQDHSILLLFVFLFFRCTSCSPSRRKTSAVLSQHPRWCACM
ncbi:Metabotropic glutamate receptor 5 [Liparis tanakae]|uniref:Metabotropic glutamate receptor 5 n=1 Tax=Liparis tanakae TaxID=230148 RepID=A0A4Z2H1V9_9TELE|nr:Metabotropic glutamate receptor 5 [Liparis tanakae]